MFADMRPERDQLPAATLGAGVRLWQVTRKIGRDAGAAEWAPFAYAVAIFTLAFLGLGYSLFPFVVIDRITIWQAAAHPSSLTVTLLGAVIVLPFIIGYSALSYRIFRGKARDTLYE